MARSAQVQKLSHRHEAVLHFMLANPIVPKGEIALRFGVTQAWLSTVINSHAFQEALANYTDVAFHETVLPLREKMMIAADRALDRLNELVPVETSLDVVRKTADSVLAACGYGAPQVGREAPSQFNQQNNTYIFGNASPEVLARARARIGQRELIDEPNGHLQLADARGGFSREPPTLEAEGSLRNDAAVPDGDSPALLDEPERPNGSRVAGNYSGLGKVGE